MTALKTISMYFRAAKVEAAEAGESTEGMANSVSKLREKILTLTNRRVDIQKTNGEFKSTYEILQGLSSVWDSLTDIDRAAITELSGGKRLGNVFSSIMENFELAQEALKRSEEDYAGSAIEENNRYLNSIEGRISIFKATVDDIAARIFQSDSIKRVVDFGTKLVDILGSIAGVVEKLGGLDTILINVLLPAFTALSVKGIGAAGMKIEEFGVSLEKLFNMIKSGSGLADSLAGSFGTLTSGVAAGLTAAVIAIELAVAVYKKFHKSTKELMDEYGKTEEQLNNVNSKIQTTTERIEELQKLLETGNITIVEKAELDRLEEENKQLEARNNILKESIRLEEDAANKSLRRDFSKKYGADGFIVDSHYMQVYRDAVSKYNLDPTEDNASIVQATRDDLLKVYRYISENFLDQVAGKNQNEINYYQGFLNQISMLLDPGASQKAIYNMSSQNGWTSVFEVMSHAEEIMQKTGVSASDLETYISNLSSGSYAAASNIDAVSNAVEGEIITYADFSESIDNAQKQVKKFATAQDKLKGGKLSKEEVFDLVNEFPQLIDYVDMSSDTFGNLSEGINKLREQSVEDIIDNITDALESNAQMSEEDRRRLVKMRDILKDVTNSASDATEAMLTFSGALSTLESMQKSAEAAYTDIKKDGLISVSSIASLEKEFADVPDIQKYVTAIVNAGKNTAEAKKAIEELYSAGIKQSGVLKGITKDNYDWSVSTLKAAGVTNAEEVAIVSLMENEVKLATAKGEANDVTLDSIKAMLAEKGANEDVINAVYDLAVAYADYQQTMLDAVNDGVIARIDSLGIELDAIQTLSDAYAKMYEKRTGTSVDQLRAWGLNEDEIYKITASASSLSATETEILSDLLDSKRKLQNIKGRLGGTLITAPNTTVTGTQDPKEKGPYVAEIEDYRKELERVRKAEEAIKAIDRDIAAAKRAENIRKEIDLLTKQLDAYKENQNALHSLNEARRKTIEDNIEKLKKLDFEIEYNADKNSFYVKNLEHLNELNNDIVKDTEKLIEDTGKLNDKNAEASEKWWELSSSIEEAHDSIRSILKDGLDKTLKYVEDMIKHSLDDQKKDLEDQKKAFSEIIDLKKKSLQQTQKEEDHEKEVSKRLKEISKLQAKINALSLDDSRAAQAEKAKLEEQLAEKQSDLYDYQRDYAIDKQEEALDKMKDDFEDAKDKEIKEIDNTLSSEQKLYDAAIKHIENNWDTLFDELKAWNYEYGSSLESELTSAWDVALLAAKRYGSFVGALNGVNAYDESATGIISRMKENSKAWHTSSAEERKRLESENEQLAKRLGSTGIPVTKKNGVWYLSDGRKLFDVYHSGGIVGGNGSLGQNELMAILEKGEAVLTDKEQAVTYRAIDFLSVLSEKLGKVISSGAASSLFNSITGSATYPKLAAAGIGAIGSGGIVIQNLEITTPVSVLQKLDREEIKECAALIGEVSSQYIRNEFTKRGVR